MKSKTRTLSSPVRLKWSEKAKWPRDPFFYYVTADGLYLCRNHPLFMSSIPVETGPGELAAHRPFLKLRYPKLSRTALELIIGFFDQIAELHGGEAAVLLAWDRRRDKIRVIVPDQTTHVTKGWYGRVYADDVKYQTPPPPSPDLMFIGDAHCHVDGPAYSSYIDKRDELHRPGLHIVVGRIRSEPPEFHIEATVDGFRFKVRPELVLSGYEKRRRNIPQAWIDKVQVEVHSYYTYGGNSQQNTQSTQATTKSYSPPYDDYDDNTGSYQSGDTWGKTQKTLTQPNVSKTSSPATDFNTARSMNKEIDNDC